MTLVAKAPPEHKRAMNKFEAVRCNACGRTVRRKARQQKYCSDRCREYGRGRSRKAFVGGDTGAPTNPPKILSQINVLQGAKSGSSIPLNVLGGYRWPNAIAIDRGLRCTIGRAESGEAAP
jgi:hypothetical protein